ncbi:MAG: sialidase family protein [Candidatus Thermoplasmatota archaeon]
MKKAQIYVIYSVAIIACLTFQKALSLESYVLFSEGNYSDYALTNGSYIDTDPIAFQASNGTVYLFWENHLAWDEWCICNIYMMTNNGTGWSHPISITNDTFVNKDPFAFQDKNGILYLFFTSNKSGNYNIYEMINNGFSWSEAKRVTESEYDDFDPWALECVNGSVYLFWSRKIENTSNIFQMVRSNNNWSPPERITSLDGSNIQPTAYQTYDETIHLYWVNTKFPGLVSDIYTIQNSGTGWSNPIVMTDSSKKIASPFVICDRENVTRLYVIEGPHHFSDEINLREFIVNNGSLLLNNTITSTHGPSSVGVSRLSSPCAFEDLNGIIRVFGEYRSKIYELTLPMYGTLPWTIWENITFNQTLYYSFYPIRNVTYTDGCIQWLLLTPVRAF